MSIRCAVGWHAPMTYGSQGHISGAYYDGINRAHRRIQFKCDRCGAMIEAGSVIDPVLTQVEIDHIHAGRAAASIGESKL